MNLFERIPTTWLLTGAGFACLLLWAGPGWAQDAAMGRRLFEDTPNESGVPTLGTCTNCHTIGNRRNAISNGQGDFADITFDRAMTEFGTAISQNLGGSMGQFSQLGNDNIRHIAAYLSDTPKVTSNLMTDAHVLPFVATAVGNARTQDIVIRNGATAPTTLQVTGITLSSGTTGFVRAGNCIGAQATAGNSCTFSVTYTPTSTAAESKTLTIALRYGSTNFNRTVTLNGSVQGTTPPPQPPVQGGGDSGGGGALGLVWLAGLALATGVLARRRRDD